MHLDQLGRRVRTLRLKKGLSQEKLAESAGLNGKYLGEVERGAANISVVNLDKISKVLGVPLLDVLMTERELTRENLEVEIEKMIAESNDDQLKAIYRFNTLPRYSSAVFCLLRKIGGKPFC
ncbi:hypothetical protein FACS1894206_07070 [Deltaproteobacteria bacterium]|nr:hypothetical protein FACS1894206_07070 [Deltaproteobacteria bacterium]